MERRNSSADALPSACVMGPTPLMPGPGWCCRHRPGCCLREGPRGLGGGVGWGTRVELDAELVLDDGGRDEPAPIQLHGTERPAPDQVADAGLRHADHLGHLAGPIGHSFERPLYGRLLQWGQLLPASPGAADTTGDTAVFAVYDENGKPAEGDQPVRKYGHHRSTGCGSWTLEVGLSAERAGPRPARTARHE